MPCAAESHALDVIGIGVAQNEPWAAKLTLRDWTGHEIASFHAVSEEVEDVRISPKGTWAAFAGQASWANIGCREAVGIAKAGSRRWTAALCDANPGPVPTSVSWSVDEARLLFIVQGVIYELDVESRQIVAVGKGEILRWSPVDDRIAIVDADRVMVVPAERLGNLTTDDPRQYSFSVPGAIASGLEWSPDGTYISVVHRTRDQPGDGRVRTALGVVDTRTRRYSETPIRLWGDKARLRWVNLPPSRIDDLIKIRDEACKNGSRLPIER